MPAKRGPVSEADYSVEDRGYETPCWIWNGPVSTQGYAQVGRQGLGHALVYAEAHGVPPTGFVVHHRCEQKICVRLGHLEALLRRFHPSLHRKYGDDVVEEIRRAIGSTRQIARRYGVSKSHVALLRRPS